MHYISGEVLPFVVGRCVGEDRLIVVTETLARICSSLAEELGSKLEMEKVEQHALV